MRRMRTGIPYLVGPITRTDGTILTSKELREYDADPETRSVRQYGTGQTAQVKSVYLEYDSQGKND